MIELFIENQRADISQDAATLLTFAIDDISDFSSRNTAFSKTIVMPGTNRNNMLFGSVFEFGSSNDYDPTIPNVGINFNAAITANALLFQDNIQIFKGVIRLLEIIIYGGTTEYETSLVGDLGGFAANLGALHLEDLSFDEHNLDYTIANIIASWDNAPGSGVYFPLIDYGTYSIPKHDWNYRTLRPALYVKEYIDKIFAAARFTYNCPLFSTSRFKALIVPHNRKMLTYSGTSMLDASGGGYTFPSTPDTAYTPMAFTTITGNIDFDVSTNTQLKYIGANVTAQTVTFGTTIKYKLSSNFNGDVTITLNGTGIYTYNLINDDVERTITLPFIYSGDLNTNDTFTLEARQYRNASGAGDNELIIQSYSVAYIGTGVQDVEYNLGDLLHMSDCIPQNYLQIDFFSSILKLFNLYVTEDQWTSGLLNIKPYVDFYSADPSTADNWTQKLDISKPVSIKPMSELNSRYYTFTFDDDTDFYNDAYKKAWNISYGSYLYDSAFQFSSDTADCKLIFAGSPLVGYIGEDKLYTTILKSSAGIEEGIDSKIRILQSKKISCTSWNILDSTGGSSISTNSVYGYAGHIDDPIAPTNDIQFGLPNQFYFVVDPSTLSTNQFNVYWSPYMAEITDKDSRLLTATFRLNTQDIFSLDFSKYKYINGSFWRLNSIADYNATDDDVCTVALLKVINTSY
jgi:hypothetical protein